jgi:long-chain acyl-CoA synthetase
VAPRDGDTLQDVFSRLGQFGEAPAIITTGAGGESWSYADLAGAVERFAAALARRGIRRGERVAIVAGNGPRWVAAFGAIVAAGAVAVPLDAQSSDAELSRALALADCRAAFADQPRRIETVRPGCVALALSEHSAVRAAADWRVAVPDAPAALLFTSGTTGTPKPVPLSHRNILSNLRALDAERLVGARDRALLPLPLHHIYALTVGLLVPLAVGAAVVFPAGVSGPELAEALHGGGATVLVGVPRLYTALLAVIRARIARTPAPMRWLIAAAIALSRSLRKIRLDPAPWLLRPLRAQLGPELRLLVSGGAALDAEVECALGDLGWEVLTGYGLTETSPILTFTRRGAARPGTAGQALPGVSLRIAAPDADGIGGIEAKGTSVFAGDRDDQEATGNAFTPDGWLRTGDFGFIDGEGYLHVVGRSTETIVLAGGKKLVPEDIERAFASSSALRELAVLEDAGRLVALVVPQATGDAAAQRALVREALTHGAQSLPGYARPSGFALTAEPLPRTPLGKIRRHLLPTLYARARAAQPDTRAGRLSEADAALLADPSAARVWHWLERRFPNRAIELDASPQLELGIDSLGWVELTLDLQRELGVVLTQAQLERVSNLRDLVCAAAESGDREPAAPEDARWIAPIGPLLRLVRALGIGLARAAMRGAFRLSVSGLDNLPSEGSVLLCPNHASYLDPFAVAAALPPRWLRRTYWGGWTGLMFAGPWRRLFSRGAQVIPVDPERGAATSLVLAAQVLARGDAVVWFPEGARSRDGTLQPFQPGVGVLVQRAPQVPIVPVRIGGTLAAWPPGRRMPRLRSLTVSFGPALDPVRLRGECDDDPRRIAEAIRGAVARLAESDHRTGGG